MTGNFYDSDRAVGEYLLFHYGTAAEILPYPFGPRDALEFPVRCVRECVDLTRLPATARAVDFRRGCDLLIVHSRRERRAFAELVDQSGADLAVGLARLPFLPVAANPRPASDDGA